MGGGNWNTEAYATARTERQSTGRADFGHDDDVRRGKAKGVHALLDPKGIAKSVMGVRESRDSEDHPQSLPIMIVFDVTGSMGNVPRVMQQKLPQLMDIILEKTGVADPQILMSAVGDWHSDQYPVQVGQFESDNRFDEQLRNIILEGYGGGQRMESYGHAFYVAARLTATDAWEKRGKKGYLFTIGDEMFWPELSARELNDVYGVGAEVGEDTAALIKEAQKRWETFHIVPTHTSHGRSPDIHRFWREHMGERVILLDDERLVCETIAGVISMMEDAATAEKAIKKIGLSGPDEGVVSSALSKIVPTRKGGLVSV